MHKFCCVAACGLAMTGIPALADHIPGHDNCDSEFPMPLPGQQFFSGGILFVTFIGPLEDDVITNTTFDITWVSDGATPASNLFLALTVQVDFQFVEFCLSGADLGFGSGPGTFKGTLSTDALNGVVWPGFMPPNSTPELFIDAVGGGGIQGTSFFVDSFIRFDVIPAPPCNIEGACCHPIAGCSIPSQSNCEGAGGQYFGDGSVCTPDPCCVWDCDGGRSTDGVVGITDLLTLLAQWGTPGGCDFDGDGVGITDFLDLLAHWGPCP